MTGRAMFACPNCGRPVQTRGRCPACPKTRRTLTTAGRGYNNEHRRRSEQMRAAALWTTCPLCNRLMLPGQDLHLDHTTPLAHDPSSKGDRVVHAHCNEARGANT